MAKATSEIIDALERLNGQRLTKDELACLEGARLNWIKKSNRVRRYEQVIKVELEIRRDLPRSEDDAR